MIDKPVIVKSKEQLTATVHVTVPKEEIRKVMGPGLGEVQAAITAQGVAATGPWLTHHLRMDPKVFVASTGRVQPGQLTARKVARTVYHGDYEGLGSAWGEFMAWIKAQGLTPAPDLWEVYAVGPEAGADPSQWRTELNQPLVD